MKLQKGLLAVILGGAFIITACKCERKGEYAVDNTATETLSTPTDETINDSIPKAEQNEADLNKIDSANIPSSGN